MKRKITIFGIWLIVLLGILGAIYGLYDFYYGEFEDDEESVGTLFNSRTIYLTAIIFTFILSIGLIVRSKISRWITLLFSYYNIIAMISIVVLMLVIGSGEVLILSQIALVILSVLLSLFGIYVLSNQEALKLFSIKRKSNKKETSILIVIAALIALLPYLLSFLIMKNLTEDAEKMQFNFEKQSENINMNMRDMAENTNKMTEEINKMQKDLLTLPAKKLTSFERQGKYIYTREECFFCHSKTKSQKPIENSTDNEEMVENSFQWGSKKTGPNLAELENELSDKEIRTLLRSQSSTHEVYPWLFESKASTLRAELKISKKENNRYNFFSLEDSNTEKGDATEIEALIAYLHTLGRP